MTYLSKINPKTPIIMLWLPGTHDSLAYNIPFKLFLRTQSFNFTEQLELGVRVFDVRLDALSFNYCHKCFYCRTFDNELIPFEETLIIANEFLHEHKSDFIVMLVKMERNAHIPYRDRLQTLMEKYNCLELTTLDKTLEDVSGKICIIDTHRYSVPKQDEYANEIIDKLHEFRAATYDENILLNYSSVIGVPILTSKIANIYVKTIIRKALIPQWYMIDFINEELIDVIISKNFEK